MNNSINPFEEFNKAIALKKGGLGLILGEKGSGKTACLINLGINCMLKGLRIMHVSVGNLPEGIENHYRLKIKETIKAKDIKEIRPHDLEIKKTILSFLGQDLDLKKLDSTIKNLDVAFDIMLIDGLEIKNMDLFQGIKKMSQEHGLETWITYPISRYIKEENELRPLFDVIFKLCSDDKGVYVQMIKGKRIC